ncbi:Os07g0287250 [Oryza sativa Japonica Group]|uniref:Os07g0287250 protein n=1 Tax=Oryza sativa subsp. japonica TaxID=39947 RepID=A0A0P0X4Q4_ORYSJ|nr:Os07g0287250 [Oryza sativa Japonica Group]
MPSEDLKLPKGKVLDVVKDKVHRQLYEAFSSSFCGTPCISSPASSNGSFIDLRCSAMPPDRRSSRHSTTHRTRCLDMFIDMIMQP